MEANFAAQAGLVTSHGWVPVTLLFDMSRLRLDEPTCPPPPSAVVRAPAPTNQPHALNPANNPAGPFGPFAPPSSPSEFAEEPTTVLHTGDSSQESPADTLLRNLGASNLAHEHTDTVAPPTPLAKPPTVKQRLVRDAALLVTAQSSKDDAEKAAAALAFLSTHRAELGSSFGYESDPEPDVPSEDWHVVSRGLKTGLFHTAVRTTPLVDGVSRNAHQGAKSKGQAAIKYLNTLAINGVAQIV